VATNPTRFTPASVPLDDLAQQRAGDIQAWNLLAFGSRIPHATMMRRALDLYWEHVLRLYADDDKYGTLSERGECLALRKFRKAEPRSEETMAVLRKLQAVVNEKLANNPELRAEVERLLATEEE
jgi:hypothetical protein